MPPLTLTTDLQNRIVMVLRNALPDALAIYAFGSRIRGEAHTESDLDLAVLVQGYEIYFDAHGELRTSVKFGFADKPMAIVTDPNYEDALEFIIFHLHAHRARLKFQPGERNPKTIQITSEAVEPASEEAPDEQLHELSSVTLDGVELLREIDVDDLSPWRGMLRSTRLTRERIKAKVSEELAIPQWALTIQCIPTVSGDLEFVVPEGKELDPSLALQGA